MKNLALLFLLLVGCATEETASPLFSGGNGKSHEDAIIIHQGRDEAAVRAAVESWVRFRYSGARTFNYVPEIVGRPSHGFGESREYRQVTFVTAGGEKKTIYFDITEFVR